MIAVHGAGSGLGVAGVPRPFGDLGDGGFEDLQLGVGGADGKTVLLDADDNADDAAAGENFVTGADAFEQGCLLLGLLLLREDEDKVKDKNDPEKGNELDVPWRGALLPAGRRPQGQNCVGRFKHRRRHAIEPTNLGANRDLASFTREAREQRECLGLIAEPKGENF